MPEIFNSPDCASRKDSFSHAFVGFIQMLQVDKRLSRYSQGSALQQKTRLISDIKERSQLASAEYHNSGLWHGSDQHHPEAALLEGMYGNEPSAPWYEDLAGVSGEEGRTSTRPAATAA